MQIKKVGVIGAGIIGRGVAQSLSLSGFEVILLDVSESSLDNARSCLLDDIRLYGFINPAAKVENYDSILKKIDFSTDYQKLAEVDYVIENVTEKLVIKKDVYYKISEICKPDCIFAANTSALSITRIASLTNRQSLVIGVHFMNPVPLKNVVEVIKGYHTDEKTILTTKELLLSMGKEGVLVQDWPGFVSNRVLMLTINEAIYLVQDQVARPQDVDRIFKGCFEHKMGPLETADMIGLDTILYSIEVLYESFNDGKYRPCPLLKKMVNAGLLGRKSGNGFYNYTV